MALSHLLNDLHDAWTAVTFARPTLLWLLCALPLFAGLSRWAKRRRRRAWAEIARPGSWEGLRTPGVRNRWVGTVAFPLGWTLLVLGLAGPRWGKSEEGGAAVGRDLVVVVDLSRSMSADDMSEPPGTRFHAAKNAVLDLLDAVSRRGGHRVGLVVFAAKPAVLCPLTTDYDHVKAVAASIDGRYPPPECRPGNDPGVVSGTRIGSALAAAVGLHDSRFPGSQDVVLLSDGDDPVDDQEWRRGADAARAANIPVHAVGLGNPDLGSRIEVGDGWLDFVTDAGAPETVTTRLHEAPLKAIAEETRGQYVPARRVVPPLGEFFRTRIEPHASREVSDDALPQPKERFAWFLAPALMLLVIGWTRGQ